DRLIDLVDGKNLPLIFHKEEKDIILYRGELHVFSVHSHFLQIIIDPQASHLVDLLLRSLGSTAELCVSAKLGLHPCNKLQRIEGLRHIVVSPHVEPQDLIRILRFRRQDDDRDTVLLPDLKGGSDSVQFRHHDVQDQKVHILLLENAERLYAVVGFQDMISLLGQIDLDRVYYFFIVITY